MHHDGFPPKFSSNELPALDSIILLSTCVFFLTSIICCYQKEEVRELFI